MMSNRFRLVGILSLMSVLAIVTGFIFRPTTANHHTPRAESDRTDVLSAEARERIWAIEQTAFQLSKRGFAALADAVVSNGTQQLKRQFADGFRGVLPSSSPSFKKSDPRYRVEVYRGERVEAGPMEVASELARLSGTLSNPKVMLKLIHLHPHTIDGSDEGWSGTFLMRIFGTKPKRTEVVLRCRFESSELPESRATATGWITRLDISELSIVESTRALMRDATTSCGIDVPLLHDNWKLSRAQFQVTPGGTLACDYNSDLNTDLLILDHDSPARLYRGVGDGTFEDVTVQCGLPLETPRRSLAAVADLDADSDLDIVLGNWLLENRDGRFVQTGAISLPNDATGLSLADYDRDGRVDLYISNQAPSMHSSSDKASWIDDQSGTPNRLLRNAGDFVFEDVTESTNAGGGARSAATSLWLDANQDGWPDIYVTNELGNNVLLVNDKTGKFRELSIGSKIDGFAMGAACGDFNNDGTIDIYLGNMFSKAGLRVISNIPAGSYSDSVLEKMHGWVAGNILLINRGDLTFEPETSSTISEVGWAYGPAMVDLDGDGQLDLFATAGFASFSRDEPDG